MSYVTIIDVNNQKMAFDSRNIVSVCSISRAQSIVEHVDHGSLIVNIPFKKLLKKLESKKSFSLTSDQEYIKKPAAAEEVAKEKEELIGFTSEEGE